MSSTRRSSRSRLTDAQICDLASNLQQLLPAEVRRSSRSSHKVSASTVLQETCDYIKSLNREVDNLSDRLSVLLESTDRDGSQAAIIRSLMMM